MPALPFEETGNYIVAAFIFVMLVITCYLAIVAAKLARIERELNTLTKLAEKGNKEIEDNGSKIENDRQ